MLKDYKGILFANIAKVHDVNNKAYDLGKKYAEEAMAKKAS